MPFEGQKDAAL